MNYKKLKISLLLLGWTKFKKDNHNVLNYSSKEYWYKNTLIISIRMQTIPNTFIYSTLSSIKLELPIVEFKSFQEIHDFISKPKEE